MKTHEEKLTAVTYQIENYEKKYGGSFDEIFGHLEERIVECLVDRKDYDLWQLKLAEREELMKNISSSK